MPPKANAAANKAGRKAANGYKLPAPLPAGEVLKAPHAKKEWMLGQSIGVGGFGEIYLAREKSAAGQHGRQAAVKAVGEDAPLAVKIEPHENGPLFVEMNFYLRAAKPDMVDTFKKDKRWSSLGMPVLRGSGSHMHKGERYRFLVMDRYGKDVQKIFDNGKKTFPVKVAYTLAVKIVSKSYVASAGAMFLPFAD